MFCHLKASVRFWRDMVLAEGLLQFSCSVVNGFQASKPINIPSCLKLPFPRLQQPLHLLGFRSPRKVTARIFGKLPQNMALEDDARMWFQYVPSCSSHRVHVDREHSKSAHMYGQAEAQLTPEPPSALTLVRDFGQWMKMPTFLPQKSLVFRFERQMFLAVLVTHTHSLSWNSPRPSSLSCTARAQVCLPHRTVSYFEGRSSNMCLTIPSVLHTACAV